MSRPDIQLHIEELVLNGLPDVDGQAIREGIQRELARLLAEQGVPPALGGSGGALRVDGGAFDVAADADAGTIAVQVAQAVYGGLTR